MKYRNCVQRFKLGKTLYISTKEVVFPIVVKVEEDDFIQEEIMANVIDHEKIMFLCGKKTFMKWRTALDFEKEKLKFNDSGKSTKLMLSKGGHMLINLERVGEWIEVCI